MVMKRNMMRVNLTRSIVKSLGRYIAIVAIIALGCSVFVGLRITKTDMVATGQDYTDQQNMFDLRLLSSIGWEEAQLERIQKLPGVQDAEGGIFMDAFTSVGGKEDDVFRFHSIPERINQVYLLEGRMPESPDECLVDGDRFDEDFIGRELTLSEANDEATLDAFKEHKLRVVGLISTPLYMDMNRGSTTIGSGALETYIYVPRETFALDYYTEIFVTLPGDWAIYTDAYTDMMDQKAEELKPSVEPIAQTRLDRLIAEAEKEWADGYAKYEDGLQQYLEGKQEAEDKMAEALEELQKAQKELDEGKVQLEDGEKQLAEAEAKLAEGFAQLKQGRVELENAKSQAYTQMAEAYATLMENYKQATDGLKQLEEGLIQLDAGLAQIDDGLAQIDSKLPLLQLMIRLQESQIRATEAALKAALLTDDQSLIDVLTKQLEELNAQLTEYQTQLEEVNALKLELETTRAALLEQRVELVETRKTLQEGIATMEMGFKELEASESMANNQFAAAEAQLNAGQIELEAGQQELNAKKAELEEAKRIAAEGEQQLKEGWAEYEKGKQEAEEELSKAEAELADAKKLLDDGRKAIDEMEDPSVFVMTRNTNAGYMALDSNSDIVSGIAEILPVFFILIAALVCITTMTRMVEEERTQIGTLIALGHFNRSIMAKYLWYSVSAAILGCSIGVLLGTTIFPKILWDAYSIMFNIRPDLVLTLDWELCLGITAAYLVSSTAVTWYCCRRTMKEVPADLIRPKPPEVGRAIVLEKLPLWKKLSFLNKVMLRNVMRYKQRLAMMLIGIGGCTALLLTGFGLRDTILGLADAQFSNVSHFDIEAFFSAGLTDEQQEKFVKDLKETGLADGAGFFYQTSAELHFDGQSRDLYLIAADHSIYQYMTFLQDEEELSIPKKNEILLSVGASEILDVKVGDTVELRNSDLESMTVKVAGIYENHVYNYVVMSPETLRANWDTDALPQMAYINLHDGADPYQANKEISKISPVINTSVAASTADSFDHMMDALEVVIAVVVICAGLLGAIVLYNLTNININERIREIATIKVLGFNAAETSAYVFKENILLTVLGVIIGIPTGIWFLDFVMEHIKIDMVWFKTNLTLPSYIYSVLLTLLCAAIVDVIFYKKLDDINMAEALKSVE